MPEIVPNYFCNSFYLGHTIYGAHLSFFSGQIGAWNMGRLRRAPQFNDSRTETLDK
jgi:hypothetical protein